MGTNARFSKANEGHFAGRRIMDLAAVLISQYLASLEMQKQAIILCPVSLWNAPGDKNKFWQVAYHALFFTHEYLQDSEKLIIPWVKHRDGYEDFPAPQHGEPYDKETILEYLAFCQQQVAEKVPQMDPEKPERQGSYNTLELQIYSIRHIMQHTGELMARLSSLEEEIDWVGSKRS
jgi:hypothetical protein